MSTIKADNIATLAGVSTSMANAVNGSAKAWVNFNGQGTVAIRGSYNVSSITDNGTGKYTVNFTNAMPDANYATVINMTDGGSNNAMYAMPWNGSTYSTTAMQFQGIYGTASYDSPRLCVAIFS